MSCPDEHGQVDVVLVVIGVSDGDHGLTVGDVLVAEGCSSVVVLTVWTQVRSLTLTLMSPPQIQTLAFIETRVRIALI